jgi:flagellar motor switch protein FliN/FliY
MSDETLDPPGGTAANEGSSESPSVETGQAKVTDESVIAQEPNLTEAGDGIVSDLPVYARGLLKIRVPVRVTLASQRKSIQEIIELGPGSIVKFDKTCDEPLELFVGDRPIATGEVVKVGDKFGLRVGALLTP